ncbi:membrane protease YdiL (CAAX protease family) [Lysobacter niastensis]|uniref:Membrane protease YdiL (CAAX protease family) n=1 Tax=Lysobacter niastensis TaxID=380629 RepID=A0ABU1WF63_9GAMM|nr:CPBP family intramembrane glutamic endopeptidase [Lysobacter niastensis]MDR7136242.1 membrane protease YdiL (CAAX protease family) [Lysobacter niastensis]
MERDDRPQSLLAESVRAHLLRFERPLTPTYGNAAGLRVLVAFLVVGVGLFFALRFVFAAVDARGAPAANLGFVVALLAAFVVAQQAFVGVPMSDVGLRRFSDWTRRERLYFLQVVPLAAVLFAAVFGDHLAGLRERHGLVGFLLLSIPTGLLWGAVQEFLYRGWLQTEMTRRFGGAAGLLAANIAFTFGPLHVDYFAGTAGVRWGGLLAVFGIGLFFGIIYRRSGNAWIPAVLHGLWPLNMT